MSIVHEFESEGAAEFGCAQAGCRECQDSLVRQHEGLVHYVVRRQAGGSLAYEDLLQVGRVGLWQAVLHFDVGRGVAFSTYACVAIERWVWRAVKGDGRPQGGLPGLASVDLRDIAEEAVWRGQVQAALKEAVQHLPERMRQVLMVVYGLDGRPLRSLAELGREQGVSREAIRYWHNKALVVLRLPLFSARLRQVYGQDSRAAYAHTQRLTRAWQRQRRRRGS
jgi:RNA polymerase sigma factor (sigma-70 family)